MPQNNDLVAPRKVPKQTRSKITVDAILEASMLVLLNDGYEKFNTNRIAEKAGVSIGSFYQYFPNKISLIVALWQNNADTLKNKLIHAFENSIGLPFRHAFKKTIEATCDAHLENPDAQNILNELFINEIEQKTRDDMEQKAQNKIHPYAIQFLSRYKTEFREGIVLENAVTMKARVVQAIVHDAMVSDNRLLGRTDFIDEQVLILTSYLTAKAD